MKPPMLSYRLEEYDPTHRAALRDLVGRLDDWFEPAAWDTIKTTLAPDTTLLAVDGAQRVIGFVVVRIERDAVGRIAWAGVDASAQRRGVGRAMFDYIIGEARAAGLTELRVETMSDTVDYAPFERTRAFYQALGFTPAVELGDHAGVGLATTDWARPLVAPA